VHAFRVLLQIAISGAMEEEEQEPKMSSGGGRIGMLLCIDDGQVRLSFECLPRTEDDEGITMVGGPRGYRRS